MNQKKREKNLPGRSPPSQPIGNRPNPLGRVPLRPQPSVVFNLPIGGSSSVVPPYRSAALRSALPPSSAYKTSSAPPRGNPILAARPRSRSSSGNTTATLAPANSCHRRWRPPQRPWARLGGAPCRGEHLGEAVCRGELGIPRINGFLPAAVRQSSLSYHHHRPPSSSSTIQ
jgi:hypothetical protein